MNEPLRIYLLAWLLVTTLSCVALYARTRIELGPMPDDASATWSHDTLHAARRGLPLPAAPTSAEAFRAAGPIFVSAYLRGEQRARYVGTPSLTETLRGAAAAFAEDPKLGFPASPKHAWRFRIGVTRGRARLLDFIPGLRVLALVPLRDGVSVTLDGRTHHILPDEIFALGLYDRAVKPPIPDLTFGTDLDVLMARAGEALRASASEVRARAEVTRVRVDTVEHPKQRPSERLSRDVLSEAARSHVEFILRHQAPTGRYAYIYDGQLGEVRQRGGYSYPRHGGTTFFLAQAAEQLDMPAAREGALRALDYVRKYALRACGDPPRLCVVDRGRVEFGATALTALAAAELLRSGDDPRARELLGGLTAFIRSQQRADGELMHEYDRKKSRPIDVQHMYYSGEAALALLTAYEQLGDARDLAAVKRLMAHLTGGAWSFFGSRYFYGEEHWTCQAVGKAAAHMDVTSALEFCVRWAKWQEKLQYRQGQTPWPSEGALGVGPVILPRITTASSRVEATVPIYRVLKARNSPPAELRALIERALRLLLRSRWSPGPDFLFRSPLAAHGGMPNTPAELTSRVDVVQHAGSALLAWLRDGDFEAR
jgi:hypothetical protein